MLFPIHSFNLVKRQIMLRVLLLSFALLLNQVNCQVELDTRLGKVIGFNAKFEEHTLDVFYGIPFGKPPVGELRFMKSELVDELPQDPYKATEFTSHCPIKEESVLKGAPIKEDCLVLNIWRPSQIRPCSQQVADQQKWIQDEQTANDSVNSVILESPQKIRSHVASEEKDFKPMDLDPTLIKVVSDENAERELRSIRAEEEIGNCTKTYPTIIYFYGGVGSIFMLDHHKKQSIAYDGAPLSALGDMIVVTVNYRSGPFGNLYIPGEVPGNAGFFDQALSIEWVHKNIESFCGDPNRITIFGNSLGSISVGFNLLSSYSNQYFQQAIMQSASPLYNEFSPDLPSEAYKKSLEFAENVGCVTVKKGKKSIDLKCLREVPLADAQEYMIGFYNFPSFAGDFFNLKSKLLYKVANVLNIPKDKRILIGLVSNEICIGGFEYLLRGPLNNDRPPMVTKKEVQKSLLARLALIGEYSTKEMLDIVHFYTAPERNYTNAYYDALDAITGDIAFNCPVSFFAKAAARRLPDNVYSYVITKKPKTHYLDVIPPFDWTGVCHADELSALFGQAFKNFDYFDDSDRQFSRQLIATFAHFVHHGKPAKLSDGNEWRPSNRNELNYVDLGLDKKVLRPFDLETRCFELWWPFHRRLLRDGGVAPYTKLPPKTDLMFFGIFFAVIIVLVLFIALIERCFSKRRQGYEKL